MVPSDWLIEVQCLTSLPLLLLLFLLKQVANKTVFSSSKRIMSNIISFDTLGINNRNSSAYEKKKTKQKLFIIHRTLGVFLFFLNHWIKTLNWFACQTFFIFLVFCFSFFSFFKKKKHIIKLIQRWNGFEFRYFYVDRCVYVCVSSAI